VATKGGSHSASHMAQEALGFYGVSNKRPDLVGQSWGRARGLNFSYMLKLLRRVTCQTAKILHMCLFVWVEILFESGKRHAMMLSLIQC
jgi:hypothetical protein